MKALQNQSISRDGENLSPWQVNLDSERESLGPVAEEIFDCIVIGAGITGITTGLTLRNAGKKVIIVDAHNSGFGTTGGTSAHINTFADTTYKEAESAFGEDGAKLFAGAINSGFKIIQKNIESYNVQCDFETKPGYVYAEDEDQVKQLEDLYEGTANVNVPISYVDKIPVPIPFKKAVLLPGQAQFHPLKYIQSLLKEYITAGGIIVEGTKIEDIKTVGGIHSAVSGKKIYRSENIIYATHIPPGINIFSFRCAPYRSYVLAVKLKSGAYPNALVYDMQDPYHYFRTHEIEGEELLLIGGNDHKTGHDDPEKAFDNLEKYVRKHFNISSVKYRWSSQYYIPVDGLPYVGQIPFYAPGIYCATGYNGNGMMLSSVSAEILADTILGNQHPYAELFSPSRIKPVDGFTEFVKENADVVYHFIADRLSVHETDSLKRLKPGTGKVIKLDGRKVAAYRDEQGKIHALNPVCTHAACIVNWNAEEKSWDCPCHGARYDIEGRVLNGPAERDLAKIDLE
ncbi:FAD-dependent oxidoreductase [Daejeonella sp.]|uniref:FAD-dependent oxidoreductase n=1 Tax=Daejeonella sp. TaxID=2805397 RepID=UPI00398344EB